MCQAFLQQFLKWDICIGSGDKDKMVQEILENPRKLLSVPFKAGESDIRNIIQDFH